MSGHRPFSELLKDFSPEQLQAVEEESARLNAEFLEANPNLADPEYAKTRADAIFDAWTEETGYKPNYS